MSELVTIAFVSGKGGVGKTSLASNFSWLCAKLGKTILIDLDFQNQGATGLLSLFAKLRGKGALAALSSEHQLEDSDLVDCGDGLFFLPAVSCIDAPDHATLAETVSQPEFPSKVGELLKRLCETFSFEFVILDCHGGLDFVSLAAHRVSTHTIVVTEADTVTFNGTLELLDFYEYAGQRCKPVAADGACNTALMPGDGIPPLKLLVNRLPSKFKWQDLSRVYANLVKRYDGKLHLSQEVVCFIPEEGIVADNFGEYPFLVRLAPKSIFAKKIYLLLYKLFPDRIRGDYKPLLRLKSEKRRRKVERTMISEEAANTRVIVFTFALVSCVYAFLMLAAVPTEIFLIARKDEGMLGSALESVVNGYLVKPVLLISTLIIFAYTTRSGFGLMHYYRNRYRLQRALSRAIGKSLSMWQRISLARSFMLMIGTTVGPLLFIFTAGIYVVLFAAFLWDKLP